MSKLGASVTLTDIPECLENIMANVKANKVENNILVKSLPWYSSLCPFRLLGENLPKM